jgi:hypothetical protein
MKDKHKRRAPPISPEEQAARCVWHCQKQGTSIQWHACPLAGVISARSLCMGVDAGRRARLDAERRQLPMWSARVKLVEEVRANKVLVVIGETGSGAGREANGAAAPTLPRGLAKPHSGGLLLGSCQPTAPHPTQFSAFSARSEPTSLPAGRLCGTRRQDHPDPPVPG